MKTNTLFAVCMLIFTFAAARADPIPDGTYSIPQPKDKSVDEVLVKVVDGKAAYISIVGRKDGRRYRADIFAKGRLEIMSIERGRERKIFAAKDGKPVSPAELTEDESKETRALALSTTLLLDELKKNPETYKTD